MSTYTITSGDTLGSIAIKIYNDASKWREIADLNSIANPLKIKTGQILNLPPQEAVATAVNDVEVTTQGKTVFYRMRNTTDKIPLGNLYLKGISRIGSYNTEKFIAANASLLHELNLSSSEINTLLATSKNEGNLDAVNTWDNSFMSWGMFQWTLGPNSDAGELAALLKNIKAKQSGVFKTFFANFGLDVADNTNSTTGFLTLNGNKLDTAEKKQALRDNTWALHFALAGQEPKICAVQVLHAINRFDTFYFIPQATLNNLSLNQILSSEYAATLLIDQHVNRPGHVIKVVEAAIAQSGKTANTIASGTDEDELRVINSYLEIRKTFGKSIMTDSAKRAEVAKASLLAGKISAKKGSFVSNRSLRT
jgi:LysM repeat protein